MFRVRYSRRARAALANSWLAADSGERSEITRASHEIDQILEREAYTAGESRIGPYRVLFAEPLGVLYRLEADGRTVTVARIWMIR